MKYSASSFHSKRSF